MIAVVALVVLGPKGLPSAARALGRTVSELRRATNDLRQSIELDPELRDIPRALDELNRPLISPNPYSRRIPPKDGPPDEIPPPRRGARRDIEERSAGEAPLPSEQSPSVEQSPAASEQAQGGERSPAERRPLAVQGGAAKSPADVGQREGNS